MTYLTLCDDLSSRLWAMGKYYTFGLACDGRWCVFLYTKPSKAPRLVVQGLSPRKLCLYLLNKYNNA